MEQSKIVRKRSEQCAMCKNNNGNCWQKQEAKCVRYLPEKNTNFIKIEGVVETPPEVDADRFGQMFINWVESLGYVFGGGISPLSKMLEERED